LRWGCQEAVLQAGSVEVPSHELPGVIVPVDKVTLDRGRVVHGGELVANLEVAVREARRVEVPSDDLAMVIDLARLRAALGPNPKGVVNGAELAAREQKAVIDAGGVDVHAHDRSGGVDREGNGAQETPAAGQRVVNGGVLAAAEQEAVEGEVGVEVLAHDLP